MLHSTAWSFFGMHFIWWLFWIALVGTAFATVTPVPKNQMKSGERARDILRRRYAAGQVSTEEYERRKTVLDRDEPTSVLSAPVHQHR